MDIVERLRQRIGLVKFDSDAIALHDAADTIEQLRGQVDFERECREDTYADLEKQDAEIERLREALAFYAEWGIDAPAVDAIIEEDCGDKARAALNIVLGEEE